MLGGYDMNGNITCTFTVHSDVSRTGGIWK